MSKGYPHDKVCLTTAQAVVKFLAVQYSERDSKKRRFIPAIFGIFGHGNVAGLGQALFEYGQDLPYHQPCNEQSMVHSASGFAKVNNRLALIACTASIGPGSTNMVTGAATATINRLPVLLLPSDYYANRHQGPVLQQLEHPISGDVSVNDCLRPVSRFFDRISRPEQLLTALPEAMRILSDPVETGTVTISLPQDVQAHAYDYPKHFFEKQIWRIDRREPTQTSITEAIQLLKSSRRPMIIAGGGIHYSEAWDALAIFSDTCGIPVGETFSGKGSLRKPTSWAIGGFGIAGTPFGTQIAAEADLIIAIGTRLTDVTTGSQSAFQHPDVKFIGINVAGHDAYKQGALPIIADAREALKSLISAAQEAGIAPDESYRIEVENYKKAFDKTLQEKIFIDHPGEAMSQAQLIQTLNQEARQGDCVIAAAGTPPGDLHRLWNVMDGATCYLEFGFSCMGWEIPAGLGTRMSGKHNEIFVYIGDGTYLMNPTELMTAMQENLKITVIISENHGYQIIRALQMARAGHSFGNEFRARDDDSGLLEGNYLQIDYKRNAESFGARAWHVKTPTELSSALKEARTELRACVIICETEKHRYLPPSNMWWDIASAEASNDPITGKLREGYEAERQKKQRFHY
tara:strand:+ start:9120 stop:11015 length:1896 start_codon:yes stop_codon:yes gene_type:complete